MPKLTYAEANLLCVLAVAFVCALLAVAWKLFKNHVGDWKEDHWPRVQENRPWHVRVYDWLEWGE